MISPSAYYACRDAGVPVVQTLHNFRMFCANGLLLRNGRICEDCIGEKVPWRGVAYGCYRDSRLYSVPVVAAEVIHRAMRTWTESVDAFIALTEFGKQKFIQCGLPEGRIFVKPNFLGDPPSPSYGAGEYAIFLGRLSAEKGLDLLLEALTIHHRTASSPVKIKVVGDGPLRPQLEMRARDHSLYNIDFLGRRNFSDCLDLLSGASFMVMPSVCYENFPMVIREAYACGKPVIAPRLGAMAEIVHDRSTGLLFNAGESADLEAKLQWMTENESARREMGRRARTEFENNYTADHNFDLLLDIYRKVVVSKRT
jgi:glycosyltransferase involved in cell wall biosynthesis